MSRSPKSATSQAKIEELTADLKRLQADFENYRKNVEVDKARYGTVVKNTTVMKLLPIIDDIERASDHAPEELLDNDWVKGVLGLRKNLQAILGEIGLTKIQATPGVKFDPALHDAVQFDEGSDGPTEVVESELRPGYLLDGQPIRHAMVRVVRK